MSDSESEEEYSEESDSQSDTNESTDYSTMSESEEEQEEEVQKRITAKQEKAMLLTKLHEFQQDKSPLETLVFTAKSSKPIKEVGDDLKRELELFLTFLCVILPEFYYLI